MPQTDEWISAEFQRLAEVINEYDQYLFLEMIPVADQQELIDKSKIFRIVDDRNGKVVLHAGADCLRDPATILGRLWSMDSKNGSVLLRLDAYNDAVKALKMKSVIDEQEAAKDFSAFITKNTKSRWVHEGRVRDDEFRDLGSVRTVID